MQVTLLILSAVLAAGSGIATHDIDGRRVDPFKPAGPANVLFFVCTDCPVSNRYSVEIQSICRDYRPRGVGCELLYEDWKATPAEVRKHLAEYGYRGTAAVI